MKVHNLRKYCSEGKAILSAEIESSGFKTPKTLFFSYAEKYYDYLPESADPFLPATLIPAMLSGQELEIVPPLSPKLMENQTIIQDIFAALHPSDFKRVRVIAKSLKEHSSPERIHNGTFFSLGVDSMYSMLKYLPKNNPLPSKELTHLIYIKGMELPLSTYSLGQEKGVIERVNKIAGHYNLEAIVGETNIRDVFPLNWEDHYTGPGLASTALSLSDGFKNIYIPSTLSYAIFFRLPTGPLIDSLWSLENTSIFHDGSEKDRVGKIADLIVHDAFALNNLRVCVSNNGEDYNCGKCWKCIRTMITLEILGHLKDSGSFPQQLPRFFGADLRTYDPMSLEFTRENLKLARIYGRKDLEAILERETRVGSLDVFRKGKPAKDFFKEILFYCYVKMGKKAGLLK